MAEDSVPPTPVAECGPPVATDPARVALMLLTGIVVMGVITYLGPILRPFLIAVFLFFAMRAAAGPLIRRGVAPLLAYILLFVVAVLIITVLVLVAYAAAVALQREWPRYEQRISAAIQKAPFEAGETLSDLFTESTTEVFRYVFESGLGLIELLTLTFFYLLFMLLGATRLTERVRRAFPGERGERVLTITNTIGDGMERFLKIKTQVSLGLGVSSAIIMYLFGLKGWLIWGLLFFLFNYITYIGSLAACVPPIALAYFDLGNPITATILAALIVLNRFIWIDYVEIKLSGRHLNIDSVLLFLWLAYWGWMWGVIGLILAFPMLTSLKIVLEQIESTKRWAVLMSEE